MCTACLGAQTSQRLVAVVAASPRCARVAIVPVYVPTLKPVAVVSAMITHNAIVTAIEKAV